ncbi:MAG: glycosyltransferase family 4 protein [bacterium]|nr:glycosyltransferase family 4 protein [bacterium]
MRNCLITMDYPPNKGGVSRYLNTLVEGFSDKFFVLSSVELDRPKREVKHISLFSSSIWPHWLPSLVVIWKYRNEYDRVWSSHIHPLGLACCIAEKFTRKPFVIILHGMDFRLAIRNPWKKYLTVRILKRADRVICNTQYLADQIKILLPSTDPIVVFPTLPIEMLKLASVYDDASDRPMRLLTVARLVSRKNHLSVLEALRSVPEVEYTIIGDGPMKDVLQEFIKTHNLENRVKLLDKISDEGLLEQYERNDVFILAPIPNERDVEGFGIVYLEAGYAGLPIITTDIPGVNEAVHTTGSISLKDPTAQNIRFAIEEIKSDPERRKKMGEINRVFVTNHYLPKSQLKAIQKYV